MDAPPILSFTPHDLRDLREAKLLLEKPKLAIRLANVLGSPIERGFALLPKNWQSKVNSASRTALLKTLDLALSTVRTKKAPSNRFHKILAGTAGGIGGAFGLAALPIELPISTAIMFRSIAEIARSEGHDLSDVTTRLNCLEVFALGGPKKSDDHAESVYWATRMALAQAMTDATTYLAQRGLTERTAPAIVRLISAIASRFGVIISEEVAAKALPVAGAAGGSLINVLFMDHFQQMARGHFVVKRLEKKYGTEPVRARYLELAV